MKAKIQKIFIVVFVFVVFAPLYNLLANRVEDEHDIFCFNSPKICKLFLFYIPDSERPPAIDGQGEALSQVQQDFEDQFNKAIPLNIELAHLQVAFSLEVFGELANSPRRQNSFVLGSDRYLFEKSYINNLNGVSEIKGDVPLPASWSPEESARKLNEVQKILNSFDISFAFVLYPHKAWIQPEYIPKKWILEGGRQRAEASYQRFLSALKKQEIRFVDGPKIFLDLKWNRPDIPLYTSGSTHWTDVGACQVLSQIIAQLRDSKTNSKWPDINCKVRKRMLPDHDLVRLAGIKDTVPYNSKAPELDPQILGKIARPISAFFVKTSFSGQLIRILQQVKYAKVKKDFGYYRRKKQWKVDWNQDIFTSQWVVFEQSQGSNLTINIQEFIEDLERNSSLYQKRKQELGL